MADAPLDYALPGRRRITRSLVLLVLSAVSVAIVGKLCWDKFGGVIANHATQLRAQALLRSAPAGEAVYLEMFPNGAPARQSFLKDAALVERSRKIVPNSTGAVIYHGPLGSGDRERFVHLSINTTKFGATSAATLVVRTYSVGGIVTPIAEIGGAQILPLTTFTKACSIDAPMRSNENTSLLVLTGQRDGQQLRFELAINADGRVQLVEDTTDQQALVESSGIR